MNDRKFAVLMPHTEGQRICDVGLDAMNASAPAVHAVALSYDVNTFEVSVGALRLTPREAHGVLLLALSRVEAAMRVAPLLE